MTMLARTGSPLLAFVLALGLIGAGLPTDVMAKPTKAAKSSKAKAAKAKAAAPKVAEEPPPATVSRLADWIARSDDNEDMPFVIVDKAAAKVFVYDADGKILGATPALIGTTPGDDAVPGIGDRELSDIPPEDRTTPAGRFIASYGPATGGRQVLWVDFATAISLHPVVTTHPEEKRVERLKSPEADDNRITYGCINVSRKFYRSVVNPAFKETKGVFYILPDTRELWDVFPQFWRSEFAAQAGDRAG